MVALCSLVLTTVCADEALRPIMAPGGDAAEWELCRQRLLGQWHDALVRLEGERHELAPEVLSEERVGSIIRTHLRLEVEPGCFMECYLLRPAELAAPAPAIVVLHSTVDHTIRQPAGLEGPSDMHIGLHLAERGYVAICPQCFIWGYRGAGSYDEAVERLRAAHPQATGLAKMVFDASRAIDVLVSLPEVDAERIGCIGHSLGGKETLFVAAFDDRVRAAASSEGGVGLTYCNWDAPWYLGPQIREPDFGLENHEVLALVAPRAFMLIGGGASDGEHSRPFIDAARPAYEALGAPDRLELLVHSSGHAFPPEAQSAAYEWLDRWLR